MSSARVPNTIESYKWLKIKVNPFMIYKLKHWNYIAPITIDKSSNLNCKRLQNHNKKSKHHRNKISKEKKIFQ